MDSGVAHPETGLMDNLNYVTMALQVWRSTVKAYRRIDRFDRQWEFDADVFIE